jgi:hypothetical protein
MIEYQATTPPTDSPARSSAVIEPTSNRRSGYARRATATIAGDRSMPATDNPRELRYAAMRPGPQPRSATGPTGRTSSANAPSIARSSGVSGLSALSDLA